jgi:hypothetical protein
MKATDSTPLIVVATHTSMVLPSPKFCAYTLRPLPKFGDIASPATDIAAAAATAADIATATAAAALAAAAIAAATSAAAATARHCCRRNHRRHCR